MSLPEIKATQEMVFALNVLFWKVGKPFGYDESTAYDIAQFWLAELEDKGVTGLTWDVAESQFVVKP